MGQQRYTLKEVKKRILTELDIATMLQTMIAKEEIDLNAIKNRHLIDEDGEIDLDLDLNKENYIEVVCPFHETDNPGSARLKRGDNYLKCFVGGCTANKPMNSIDLYMVLKFNVDPHLLGSNETSEEFIQAIKELAAMIDIDFSDNTRQLSAEEIKERKTVEIREKAALIYHDALKTNKYAHKAMEYLVKERGFEHGTIPVEELVDKYKIGFAPGFFGWTWLYNQLRKTYTDQELLDAGVVFKYRKKGTKEESKIIDMLTNGLVLPYFSKGRINNLYARSLQAGNKNFRHLRLKGNVDIPINWDEAIKYQDLIIVEGELSWLTFVALGFPNTLGNRGTNGLSNEHIAMLKERRDRTEGNTCKSIYLAFDPDGPGKDATLSSGKKLVAEGFDVRVMRLPNGDPNDVLKEYKTDTKQVMQALFDKAISFEAFQVIRTMETYPLSTNADKVAALKAIRPFREQIEHDLLLPIAYEVAEFFGTIEPEWLIHAWLGTSIPAVHRAPEPEEEKEVPSVAAPAKRMPVNPGLERALKYNWMVVTDNKHTVIALRENNILQNIVYVTDVEPFVQRLQAEKRTFNLVIDETLTPAVQEELFARVPEYTFKKLLTQPANALKDVTKEEFPRFVVDYPSTDRKIS